MFNNDYYYSDYYAESALWYLFYLSLVITPILPAGDMGLVLVDYLTNNHSMVWMNIIAWVFFALIYGVVLLIIKELLEKYIPTFVVIVLGYLQGVALSFLLKKLGYAKTSLWVTKVVTTVYTILTATN